MLLWLGVSVGRDDQEEEQAHREQTTHKYLSLIYGTFTRVTNMGSVMGCIWNVPCRLICYSLGLQVVALFWGVLGTLRGMEEVGGGEQVFGSVSPQPHQSLSAIPTHQEVKKFLPNMCLSPWLFDLLPGTTNHGLNPLKCWEKSIFPHVTCSLRYWIGHSCAKVTDTKSAMY